MHQSCEHSNFNYVSFEKTLRFSSFAILAGLPPISVLPLITRRFPQLCEDGEVNYLVTSGLAIEKYTCRSRRHRDIDLVFTRKEESIDWHSLKVDVVSPEKYWCSMNLSRDILSNSARILNYECRSTKEALVLVHPFILLVQKSSNHKGLLPREKDNWDAINLVNYCKGMKLFEDKDELQILTDAINSLPQIERDCTKARILKLLGKED